MDTFSQKPLPTSNMWSNTLSTLADPSLAPLFWRAERLGAPSAWWQHVPFAHWIVGAIAPNVLVELGTHTGVSYTAFCQAVNHEQLSTRCHAVDTWRGDSQAGEYGDEVYEELSRFHDARFGAFSTLLRCTFDEALDRIEDTSVDLLHIDGLHTYEAVQHDFENWLPKLSNQSVVLFHDTNVRVADFGVWQLWAELRERYPSFEFLHGHGLGVLATGKEVPAAIASLCELRGPTAAIVRARFARFGERWVYDTREWLAVEELSSRLAVASSETDRLRVELNQRTVDLDTARAAGARAEETASGAAARMSQAEAMRSVVEARAAQVADGLARANTRAEAAEVRLRDEEALRSQVAEQLAIAQNDLIEALTRAEQAEAMAAAAEARKDRVEVDISAVLARANTRAEAAEVRLRDEEILRAQVAEQLATAQNDLLEALARAEQAEAMAAAAEVRRDRVEVEISAMLARAESAEVSAVEASERAEQAERNRSQMAAALEQVIDERDQIRSSTIWQMTWPVRSVGGWLPKGLRRAIRGGAKLGWWTVTLKLPRRLKAGLEKQQTYRSADPVELPLSETALPQSSHRPIEREAQPESACEQIVGLFNLVYISGEPETPGHTYRVVRPAAAAASLGACTSWMGVEEIADRLGEIEAAHALVIWRAPWSECIAIAVEAARRGGAKVVFDVDDLMIDPELARLDVIDGIRTQDLTEETVRDHYERVRSTMMAADLCIASTEELAEHMRRALMPTLVLPNGVDHTTIVESRVAARRRRVTEPADGLVRIGYAGGSRTHQRDFALCADAVAAVLRTHPECRLVAFRSADGSFPFLDLEEFRALRDLEAQIEWRNAVPLEQLPNEVARFDINLAPLETGNPFCEAKSELKLFEAALVDVPTIASPTGPYRRAIRHGETGFLASTAGEWERALQQLVDDVALRRHVAKTAGREALWCFGPEQRAKMMASLLDLLRGGRAAARAFELNIRRRETHLTEPRLSDHEIAFEADRLGTAEVTVVVPLYNYASHVEEALESVRVQTLTKLDLIVVDDRSTDDSFAVALRWIKANAERFNRVLLLRNHINAGLARTRNSGFDAAETPCVLPLDADNRLLPECAATCLRTMRETGAAVAYPVIRQFGASQHLMGDRDFDPLRLELGNYIDAMALINKAAWVAAGGYDRGRGGWEDFAFLCRLIERGFWGVRVPAGPLAEYRVHSSSMIQVSASQPQVIRRMMNEISEEHPWLHLVWPLPEPEPEPVNCARPLPSSEAVSVEALRRLSHLLPLLRCPETGQPLTLMPEGDALVTADGLTRWPVVLGRPSLFPGMNTPRLNDDSHLSNPLPASALALIHSTTKPILHLSAGGSIERFEHVIEAEAAVFRHTDVISDVHRLPFADKVFDAVIALNSFEHYRDPRAAAREILRVLRPGGHVLIRTAFMQPMHEAPWHFYNCTRYGLEAWFEDFDTVKLHVSENFHPGYSLSWLASELEFALRSRRSESEADSFLATPLRSVVSLWRGSEGNQSCESLWKSLAALPQDSQDGTAAGFEFLGRRPVD